MSEKRIKRLYETMEKNNFSTLIFNDPITLRFFLGIHLESDAYLIFSSYYKENYEKYGILMVPQLEYEKAKDEIKNTPIDIIIMKHRYEIQDTAKEISAKLGFENNKENSKKERIGLLFSHLNLLNYKRIHSAFLFNLSGCNGNNKDYINTKKAGTSPTIFSCLDMDLIEDFSKYFSELRSIKEPDEIDKIRKAAQITDSALKEGLENLKPGISEVELAALIEYKMRKLGADKTAFDTIVASGPHSWYPHAGATERKIEEGDIVTIDIGAQYQGYCSDLTRTVIAGFPPYRKKYCEIINKVNLAQQKALERIKPGAKCKDIDKAARDFLEKEGLGKYFIHSLGHSVGIEIHESIPMLTSEADCILKPGMIVTVEPGVYIPNVGGARTEDLILITEDGYEKLSKSEIFWY
ncbi:MAG: M24 family metallopeptidase [Candidatus Helarchaeota archaeon]